ncbi:TRAP transporter substrate-binding protein [Rhizobium halophytocola]|uniref:TRAP-type C4-dicarboxylate transport system substrate-binding protein n=1 Tax=Rhizobium halophytocola TaxID=735519 RepID=A0ABS4DTV4_9HYPH|nr:TRAP transporter substrate-binding protein [Rhizobium halophytocola]MBP1849114.1 TRAP-type C4-dicarboxylate transport system substrate-binding protein [Rhizobium halophytocola]
MTFSRTILTAVALTGLAIGAAQADEMKFANFMAPTHPYVAGAFQPFADMVAKETDGAVTVKLYNGGELGGGPVDQYNRAVEGVTEFAIGLPGYTASNFPRTLLAELPGVVSEETGTAALWKNIDLLMPEYKRVKLISLWSSADNILYMRDKAVHSPADIKGLKIRVPSRNAGLVAAAWGALPVSMPVSDIYNAMQTGVIDGALIDGTATKSFKLGEVAKYLTVGMNSTNSPFFILMNRDAFEGLTDDQKAAVEKAGREASDLGSKVQVTEANKGIDDFGKMDGKELIRLTPEEAKAFNDLSAPVVDTVVEETATKGIDAKAIVDGLTAAK